MLYAVHLPNFGPFAEARAVADLAREAEQAGWDGFFIWDHVARSPEEGAMSDPWIALTAAAMTTSRLRLGPMVTPPARRRPAKLARETVSLDRLSGGRLILGVGAGSGRPQEWAYLGDDFDLKTRARMLDEALEVLTGLWTGHSFSYQGTYYHVREAIFGSPPAQQPRIPVWVGGFWPHKAPFRRAARWDGMFPLFPEAGADERLALFQDAVAFTLAQREAAGNEEPFDVAAQIMPLPGDDPDRAAEMAAPFAAAGATWWLEDIHPRRWGIDITREPWPTDRIRERVWQGPPSR